jgi:hypothetical protein
MKTINFLEFVYPKINGLYPTEYIITITCYLFIFFPPLLSHYMYNTLQIYLVGQCQSLPISITKHCHTVYIQIHYLLVLPTIIVSLDN